MNISRLKLKPTLALLSRQKPKAQKTPRSGARSRWTRRAGRLKAARAAALMVPQDAAPLVRRLTDARERQALMDGDAAAILANAPSEAELDADRALAVWRRSKLRDAERAELADQLEAAEDLRRANKAIRDADIRDVVDGRKALAEQRRAESPASGVAELRRFSRYMRHGCALIIAAGMLWSAINVQQNMAPGGVHDPMYWASFLIEAMISGLLIIIAIGTGKVREVAKREPGRGIRYTEAGLFVTTFGLNTYPYIHQGQWYETVMHGIAPSGIGAALLTLHYLGQEFTLARKDLAEQITDLDVVQLPSLDTAYPNIGDRAPDKPTVHLEAEHRAPEATQTVHGDTVQAESVHGVAASNLPTETQTVHRADESARTAHQALRPAELFDVDTVQLPALAQEQTEQFPRTAQPGTEHRAPGAAQPSTPLAAQLDQEFAELQAVRRRGYTPHGTYAPGQHDEVRGASEGVVETAVSTTAEQVPLSPKPAVHHEAEQAEQPVHGLVTGGVTARAASAAEQTEPRTVHTTAEQSPSTEQVLAHPRTVHRAVETRTVQSTVQTVQNTEQLNTEQRAPVSATTRHSSVQPDKEMLVLAVEVHGHLPVASTKKFSVEEVATVLYANRRLGLNIDRISRDKLGPHRDTCAKWLKLAQHIEDERAAGMAPVISLREHG